MIAIGELLRRLLGARRPGPDREPAPDELEQRRRVLRALAAGEYLERPKRQPPDPGPDE